MTEKDTNTIVSQDKDPEAVKSAESTEQKTTPSTVHLANGVKASDISEWYAKQYVESVGLAKIEGGLKFKNFVSEFPEPADLIKSAPFPSSGRKRMSSFLKLKLRFALGRDGYSCAVLTAQADSIDNHKANYALAYWRNSKLDGDPEYVCIAPTFDSRDGEYRRRMIPYETFAKTYAKVVQDMAPYEAAVLQMIDKGAILLRAKAYPATSAMMVKNLEASRFLITSFAVAMFLDLYREGADTLAKHSLPGYNAIMGEIAEQWPSLVKYSTEIVANPSRNPITDARNLFRNGSTDRLEVQCGVKLVPLTIRETVQFGDHALAAWRELEVTKRVGDLVLNFITPSFAFYDQWSYIEGTDRFLFDNPGMKHRYRRSAAAAEASNSMRQARGILADLGADRDYRIDEIGERLHDSIYYAQSFIMISPVVLMHTMEDVGRALHTLDICNRREQMPWPTFANIFDDIDLFAHMAFDFVYGAYCLHERIGVAHTDLHSGNLTYFMWGYADLQKKDAKGELGFTSFYKDPVTLYVTGALGEIESYVFPATGASGCIIDYSRCILGPSYRDNIPTNAERIYHDQADRVVRALKKQHGEDLVNGHEEKLRAYVLTNFESVFPVLCAGDFASIGSALLDVLQEAKAPMNRAAKDLRPGNVTDDVMKFATELHAIAMDIFISRLSDLMETVKNNGVLPPKPDPANDGFGPHLHLEGEYIPRAPPVVQLASPGKQMMRDCFEQWRFPTWAREWPKRVRTAEVVDAYNYANPIQYFGDDYTKWPAWARMDEIEKHLGAYKLSDLFDRGLDLFLSALGPNTGVEEIAAALADKERI